MRKLRLQLFVVTVILIAFGIVMVYSASAIYAYEYLKDSAYFLKRHLIYLFLGITASLWIMSVDYNVIKKYIKPVLIISFILLILVLIPGIGREIAGARRWFRFSIFSFQPSQALKLALILYIADVLSRKQSEIRSFFHGFLPPMIILGVSVGLILLQPDLGTAVAIAAVVYMMLFIAGIRLFHLVPLLVSSLPALGVIILAKPYRMKRISAFLNPWEDPQGIGFQIIQSYIALGSGGLFGVGLGQSRQKLFYLPGAHTDFIFSIIGEELGLIGTASIVILFIVFIWLGVRIAIRSRDLFGHLAALGIVLMIGLEAVINIGVATGSIPTKGLPLPFISYGGSSLIFDMMGVALLLNIAKCSERSQLKT
ncbi:MAG: putative lipid II flippase FtsW [Candidatus Omnitrophota bacterium]